MDVPKKVYDFVTEAIKLRSNLSVLKKNVEQLHRAHAELREALRYLEGKVDVLVNHLGRYERPCDVKLLAEARADWQKVRPPPTGDDKGRETAGKEVTAIEADPKDGDGR